LREAVDVGLGGRVDGGVGEDEETSKGTDVDDVAMNIASGQRVVNHLWKCQTCDLGESCGVAMLLIRQEIDERLESSLCNSS
uniref:Ovule protein n=1 Tax=Mesocestoides corti TaxID=53468 RepID=A0A5K3EVC8_MESCO